MFVLKQCNKFSIRKQGWHKPDENTNGNIIKKLWQTMVIQNQYIDIYSM